MTTKTEVLAKSSQMDHRLVQCDPKYEGAIFFRVKDDSMTPKWEKGDLVLVHPRMKPRNGDYVVVCWDNEELAFKKIFFQKEKIILQSINSHYESIIVEPSSVSFIGKVLWTRLTSVRSA